jgi:ankyrin repeat protein
VSVLRYLHDHGVDPATPDAVGDTPLHLAAEHGALCSGDR